METSRALRAAWVYDEAAHRAANAAGCNYWDLYTDEITNRLGLSAERIPPGALAEPAALGRFSLIFIGDLDAASAAPGSAGVLAEWIRSGGTLVGSATAGLDDLFGITGDGRLEQAARPGGPPAQYSIAAYLALQATPLTTDPLVSEERGLPLLSLAPARVVQPANARPLARLLAPDPEAPGDGVRATDTGGAAITWCTLGQGHAFYFAFGLPQTMWLLHQGRPIEADYDGDGFLRAMDARLIAANECTIPYSDDLHMLLQAIVGLSPVPLIHECPPCDGDIPDAVFYFGGDDECDPGNQVPASDFMASRGLPYHINCMPDREGHFALSDEDIARIRANGHELALHYDFVTTFSHPSGYTAEDVATQMDAFIARFGRPSVCSVTHCVRWVGWSEPARWMAAVGQIGDNGWMGAICPPLNPTNSMDLSFGSALPRRRWDDAAHANAVLEFVQAPILAYEVGYQGDQLSLEVLRAATDYALRYRFPINIFYHPVYLATFPACRAAVDDLLDDLRRREVRAGFMGVDEIALWWLARSHAEVSDVKADGDTITCHATCEWPAGFVLKVCTGDRPALRATVDGAEALCRQITVLGRTWSYVVIPSGSHQVTLVLQ